MNSRKPLFCRVGTRQADEGRAPLLPSPTHGEMHSLDKKMSNRPVSNFFPYSYYSLTSAPENCVIKSFMTLRCSMWMLNNCIIAITQQFYVSLTYHSSWSQTLHFIPFFPLDRLFLNRFCFEPDFLALRSSLLRSASSFKAETADLELLSREKARNISYYWKSILLQMICAHL